MPSGWNNVVSSFRGGFDGCTWTRLWDGTGFTGANQCYSGSSQYVGNTMNDKTSSVYWRVANPC